LATAVYNRETINLVDGSTLELKALSIKNRRAFMKAFDALASREVEGERTMEDNEDDLLRLIPYCVAGQRPDWEGVWSNDEEVIAAAMDSMTEALDEETMFYIIKQTAGIDLKAMAATAVEMMKQGALDGVS
jgi:hypothetical protein